jgi:hypothetical protein
MGKKIPKARRERTTKGRRKTSKRKKTDKNYLILHSNNRIAETRKKLNAIHAAYYVMCYILTTVCPQGTNSHPSTRYEQIRFGKAHAWTLSSEVKNSLMNMGMAMQLQCKITQIISAARSFGKNRILRGSCPCLVKDANDENLKGELYESKEVKRIDDQARQEDRN